MESKSKIERFHIKALTVSYNETKLIYYDASNVLPLQLFNQEIDFACIESIIDNYLYIAISNKNPVLDKIDTLDQMIELDLKEKYENITIQKSLKRKNQYPTIIKVLYNKDFLKKGGYEEFTVVKNVTIEMISIKKKYNKFIPIWNLVHMEKYSNKIPNKIINYKKKEEVEKKEKMVFGIGSISLDKIKEQKKKLKSIQ